MTFVLIIGTPVNPTAIQNDLMSEACHPQKREKNRVDPQRTGQMQIHEIIVFAAFLDAIHSPKSGESQNKNKQIGK